MIYASEQVNPRNLQIGLTNIILLVSPIFFAFFSEKVPIYGLKMKKIILMKSCLIKAFGWF
jgi:hypothetical protein